MTETEAVQTYQMRRYITDTDVDFARRLRLASMFGFFQDIAALHAANLGASVDRLHKELNVAWILMRVRVEVDRYPTVAREVVVETWPQEPRALYERDYTICDTGGGTLVRSSSTWVIMNLETREIKRDKFLDYHGLEMRKDHALAAAVGRLRPVDGAALVYEKEIKYSDVDYNNHVNNGKYVEYVLDGLSFEELRAREISAIEMHYINEMGPEDFMQLRRKTLDDGREYFEVVSKASGALAVNALVEWRQGK